MSLPITLLFTLTSLLITQVRGDAKLDQQRLGSEYTSMPLYRSGAGTNVLSVNVGSPPTEMRLTCSTNVDFFVIAATGCEECIENSNLLEVSHSQTLTITEQDLAYVFPYPSGSSSTISIAGRFASDVISDERGDEATPRPIVLAAAVQTNDPRAVLDGPNTRLTDGTGGFWGMGIYQDKKSNSIIPSMITLDNDGSTEQLSSYTVGFEINNFSTNTDDLAGTIHWGAVPGGVYEGNFNWLSVDTTVGGSWGFDLDRFRIDGEVIDLENHFGTVDPGFDSIYVPTNIAERIFARVNGAVRDSRETTRWNVPCDASIDLKITISGTQYAIDKTSLVRNRDVAGRTCWSSIVAWQNGSVPEQNGEVRLGTPFMSGVYTALYYSYSAQYVGLAGKPNSVNAANLYQRSEGQANKKLAGILIGTLLGVLIFLFILCYARNRSSMQSIWYRGLRRQQRAQMNAVVRSATLPPPIIPIVGPPMVPIIPRGPPGMMMGPVPMGMGPPLPPHMMGRMMPPFQSTPPPPYQPPMNSPQQQQGEQGQPLLSQPNQDNFQYQNQNQNQTVMPMTIQPNQKGFYSPRLQHTSPPKSSFFPLPFAKRGNNRGDHREYEEPPLSGGSRVHFGPTSARMMRSSSSAQSNSINEFGAFIPHNQNHGGPENRYNRQQDYLREYNNLQPSSYGPPPPIHPQPQYNQGPPQDELPPLAEVPEGEYIPATGRNEKKRYFSWGGNGEGEGGKGRYVPVLSPSPNTQAINNEGQDRGNRKSWWGMDRNGGWKEHEGLAGVGSPKVKRGLGWS